VLQTPDGRFGYLPLNGEGPAAPSRLNALGNLDYHGGPVMSSNAEYAIFWAPSGFAFPAGYTAAVTKYLHDVAADSGKPTNVYSVGTQYTDSSGAHAGYGTTFGGALNDTNAYPSSGCPSTTASPSASPTRRSPPSSATFSPRKGCRGDSGATTSSSFPTV
jgi:hypothetical protein